MCAEKEINMDWVEALPSQCPPTDAFPPEGVYYRAVSTDCSEGDFIPYARLYPTRQYIGSRACTARALSIYTNQDDCVKATMLPALQKLGQTSIAKVTLTKKDGLVQKGHNIDSHHSWWRTRVFDLNTSVELINATAK